MDKFEVNRVNSRAVYYVYLLNFFHDIQIADLMGMQLTEYGDLTIEHGAKLTNCGYVWHDRDDAQKFADYLNKNHLIMIRLMGWV